MFPKDTIAAISTPIGPGGIGIVRLSGSRAIDIAEQVLRCEKQPLSSRDTHTTAIGKVFDPATGAPVDEALVTLMRAPNSYTREDVVEINCHSGVPTMRTILKLVLTAGARLAEPGEFTRRAFTAGRIDMTQAEAVNGLIRAKSDAAARAAARQAEGHLADKIALFSQRLIKAAAGLEAAVDFIDEDIESTDIDEVCREIEDIDIGLNALIAASQQGRILEDGVATAIVGRPNVGKSSLLNALAKEDKAIVSPQPGTTRDVVESLVVLEDIPLHIKDTAGWRRPKDAIEKEGIFRTRKAIAGADLVLMVLDASEQVEQEDIELAERLPTGVPAIFVINKIDKPQKLSLKDLRGAISKGPVAYVSAKTTEGLGLLGRRIAGAVGFAGGDNEPIMVGVQQEINLADARQKLADALTARRQGFGEEVVSLFIKEAVEALGRFSGRAVDEKVLDELFSRFCIGK